MISLSIADKYHLQFQIGLTQKPSSTEWKLHLLLPSAMVSDEDSLSATRFYQNLLQQQRLSSPGQPQPGDLKRYCQLLHGGHAMKERQFKRMLADLVNGLLHQFEQAQGDQLLALRSPLCRFLRLDRSLTAPKQRKLYKLARQLIVFQFNQALLRERHGGRCSQTRQVRRYLLLLEHYARRQGIRLGHEQEAGREKMLEKLGLCQRIIDRPYQLQRRLLKGTQMAEQLIFGFSAAMAMAFATGIAFATQRAFGNFTTPFFFSLVFSYIFKDRIKELGRNYLVEKFYSRFYQHHYRLYKASDKEPSLDIKESFYHPKGKKLDVLISTLKKALTSAETSRIEAAWSYRRQYSFRQHKAIEQSNKFHDDLTLNLSRPLRLLPSQIRTIWQQESQQLRKVDVHQVVPIYLIIETREQAQAKVKLFRLHASRRGIHRIKEIESGSRK
ncbi:hypothetical protein [Ferrimonas sp. SCSIO 43195]|uniref:hypothetical protein n=1 Tax=Ferrimonas sp. SCSIO 43195 TaxID=2822844 RepID=UPI002074B612|nr:hypothetical protein [Ferrimonas sp. SCSIO 43195]USD37397.1 hypothetical protein J8Z22_20855 [Ferrimonas sp. SCSIO 43195]